jgi:predicted phage terminase large subunit-like protein
VELHIATRWSVNDVIGRLEQKYGGNGKSKFITVPALDENDESNFDYPIEAGFTTEFYREQREAMDDASWRALYMNEPIEREGQLYAEDALRRYFELPDGEPDAIIGVCDTKDKGSDFCVLPVAYQYGQDFYIEDVLCEDYAPAIVDVNLAQILLKNKVQLCQFESNAAGGKTAEKVQNAVKERGGITKIVTKYTTQNKETKIIVNQPWVLEHCLFKDNSTIKNEKEYRSFIYQLCAYTLKGRNAHDDVPDAMAQLALYAQNLTAGKIEIIARPW